MVYSSKDKNEIIMNKNQIAAFVLARTLLGFIFLMQGFGKVFTWGVDQFMRMDFFYKPYKDILPDFIIFGTAYYTSYIELLGGLLLVLGYKTNLALYFLASVLIIVTIGHGIAEPIWDLSHVMYRVILLIGLLLMPKAWNVLSIDALIGGNLKK